VFPAVAGTGDSRWPQGVVNVYDESGMTDTMITAAERWTDSGANVSIRVVRFERDGKSFSSTMIAEQALPTWSADASGDGVFFQSDAYQGWYGVTTDELSCESVPGRCPKRS
jgi:hypothetical protein